MTERLPPLCWYCQRRDINTDMRNLRCEAFPRGVPAAIKNNTKDHRRAVKGDRGLRYQPARGAPPDADLDSLWFGT